MLKNKLIHTLRMLLVSKGLSEIEIEIEISKMFK